VLCLSSFLRKVPDMAIEIRPLVRRSLGDHDPGVVWAAVEVYQQLAVVGLHCLYSITYCIILEHQHIILRYSYQEHCVTVEFKSLVSECYSDTLA